MRIRTSLLTGILATTIAIGGGLASAQDSSPVASPGASPAASPEVPWTSGGVPVIDRIPLGTPNGAIAAYATLEQGEGGVTIRVESTVDSTLEPGTHGIHIHEVGACDASGSTPYASAGGHFNPDGSSHGGPEEEDSHAGDLGNLEVSEDGTIEFEVTSDRVSLDRDAENTLVGPNGSAIIIHAGEDDLETDPSGESGDRVACGIIFASVEPAMNATPPSAEEPGATPAATPES
jgi:Cu-Zn family superoxide dismutase